MPGSMEPSRRAKRPSPSSSAARPHVDPASRHRPHRGTGRPDPAARSDRTRIQPGLRAGPTGWTGPSSPAGLATLVRRPLPGLAEGAALHRLSGLTYSALQRLDDADPDLVADARTASVNAA